MDALAYNLYGCDALICPMMDARRGQVYTGIYTFQAGELRILKPQCAMAVEELAAELDERAARSRQEIIFLGTGAGIWR